MIRKVPNTNDKREEGDQLVISLMHGAHEPAEVYERLGG